MEDIVLAGSGGCMRELAWQIQEWNREREGWNVLGYVDREPPCGRDGVWVGGQRIPYLGDDEFLLRQETQVNAVLCVGEPKLRKKIASRLQENPHIRFPNLILGNTRICEDVQMGMGCIVSMDARISTNVTLGDFVFLNLGSGICHDGRIGDFVTLGPDVRLAGCVTVEDGVSLGLGTKIIQGITVGRNAVTGAGSIVVRDLGADCVAAGVPARKMREIG